MVTSFINRDGEWIEMLDTISSTFIIRNEMLDTTVSQDQRCGDDGLVALEQVARSTLQQDTAG